MPTFGTPVVSGYNAPTTSLEVSTPGDLQDGDILVLALRSQDSTGTTPWTVPEGFVQMSADEVLPAPGVRVGGIWAKPVPDASAEPSTFTVSGPSGRIVAATFRYRSDLPGALTAVAGAGYGGTPEPGGLSTVGVHTLASAPAVTIAAVGVEATAGVSMYPTQKPAGFTEIGAVSSSRDDSTSASRTVLWLGWREETDTAADPVVTKFGGGAAAGTYLGHIAGGAPAENMPEPGPAIPGFRSVAAMLAVPGATWAHRGGSANWPEMTEYAYEMAAAAGYGALEFSAARTSDGVWFGLHDQTLDRTSGITDSGPVSEMTWAQVQQHQVVVNAQGTPRPYYRLEDFLDDFGQDYVVILDFKYGWAHRAEFFDLVAAHADRRKVIIKFHGPTSFGAELQSLVRAAGYSSWGYYYPSDVAAGTVADTQGHWSMLGMDYTASQADWDALAAFGKPVVGHIAPSQAAYDTARAKGARMVQCADVAGIAPVGAVDTGQPWDAVYTGTSRIPARIVLPGGSTPAPAGMSATYSTTY